MSQYIVKAGETITDVVLNATGSISNWESIITANNFTDWVPTLTVGQSIYIPDSTVTIQTNNYRKLQVYPACNNVLLAGVHSSIINNWILFINYWRDIGVWIDTEHWQD